MTMNDMITYEMMLVVRRQYYGKVDWIYGI